MISMLVSTFTRPMAALLFASAVLVVGCRATEDTASLQAAAAASAPTITYYNRIGPLFASRCVSCHYQGDPVQLVGGFAAKTFQGAQAPYFTDYQSIKAKAVLAATVMKAGIMPPAKNLGPDDVADLRTWISEGMPEGDPASAPQPSLQIKAILDRRCVACHHPGGTNDLTTYESASGPIHGPVIFAALNILQNMPPAKNLTPEEFRALSDWSVIGGPREDYDGTRD